MRKADDMTGRVFTAALLLLALQSLPSEVSAAELRLTSNTITVPGAASKKVPADELRLRLALEISTSSLSDAMNQADAMAAKLRSISLPGDTVLVQVESDLSMLRQKALSWTKGKKLVYQFNMVIAGFAPEDLDNVLASAADLSLQLDDSFTINEITTQLSKAREEATLQELLGLAALNARERAEAMANATGVTIKRVNAILGASPEVPLDTLFLAAGVIDTRTRFTVYPDFDNRLEVSASVVVQFEVQSQP